jgi:hypothetical protein
MPLGLRVSASTDYARRVKSMPWPGMPQQQVRAEAVSLASFCTAHSAIPDLTMIKVQLPEVWG